MKKIVLFLLHYVVLVVPIPVPRWYNVVQPGTRWYTAEIWNIVDLLGPTRFFRFYCFLHKLRNCDIIFERYYITYN